MMQCKYLAGIHISYHYMCPDVELFKVEREREAKMEEARSRIRSNAGGTDPASLQLRDFCHLHEHDGPLRDFVPNNSHYNVAGS
jgi:hypothetical protein